MPKSVYECELPTSVAEAFAWHGRAGAFERLVPPWENVECIRKSGSIHDGDELEMRVGPRFFRQRWLARHYDYKADKQFNDRQINGPFANWEHNHLFERINDHSSRLRDEINWELPKALALGNGFVEKSLDRMFRYRHATTVADLKAHTAYADRPRMKILLGGASGLVGTQLAAFLSTGGHSVHRLVRRKTDAQNEIAWDPDQGKLSPDDVSGFDAVIHLGGANIAGGRWTDARKKLILDSRVDTTRLIADAIAKAPNPPKTFIAASAIGYYGNRADEPLTENSSLGSGFLADVCRDWEAASALLADSSTRVAHARLGIVLSPNGGALDKMLLPFKCGVGGIVGNGCQYWPWISLDDVIGGIHHILMTDSLSGPVNLVAPYAPTNRAFTKTLGQALHRPTILPLPAFAVRLIMGELGETLLLNSANVIPARLTDSNYAFRNPELLAALQHLLGTD